MSDPLSLLRRYITNNEEIIERDSEIIFGKISWPKNVKTNYSVYYGKKGKSGNEGSIKEYYTLECLLYFIKNVQLFHPEYCKQAATDKIQAVRRPDRKQLLAYLRGEMATSSSIVKDAPFEIPMQVKHEHNHDFGESAATGIIHQVKLEHDHEFGESAPTGVIHKVKLEYDQDFGKSAATGVTHQVKLEHDHDFGESAATSVIHRVKLEHVHDFGESAAKKPRFKETHKQKVNEEPAAHIDKKLRLRNHL